MLCVYDVMQVICYVIMMICKLCKPYAMCYASYASHMLCDHDVMQVMQVLGYVFMMLVMQIAMINIDPL